MNEKSEYAGQNEESSAGIGALDSTCIDGRVYYFLALIYYCILLLEYFRKGGNGNEGITRIPSCNL